jgi:thiamine-monophosphate kinase
LKTLRDIGEDALIERLSRLLPLDSDPAAGPGDDCAVIDPGPQTPDLQLLKTDALVEHVHYLPTDPPRDVGWKSIARVVSDFAAMGGKPERFLVTIALAPETSISWIEDVYRGMGDCLRKYRCVLAGGETSSVPAGSACVISISATGTVRRTDVVLRSTGNPGDVLLVTGTLGGSIKGKHLNFTPRLDETSWLVNHYKPTAMMDVSDGLAKDLPRLGSASRCGFVLERGALPVSEGSTVEQALGDGEDFEILFSMEPSRVQELIHAWKSKFPDVRLSAIGKLVEPGEGERLNGGWDHFSRKD